MIQKFSLITALAFLPLLAMSQAPVKEKFHFNKSMEDQVGYAQAVRVGNTLYISGVVGTGTMEQAIKQVYGGLEKTLKNYGATFENVVKENLYAMKLDDVIKNSALRKEYYKNDFPAATWVQIDRLYMPEAVLEVEVVAILNDDKK